MTQRQAVKETRLLAGFCCLHGVRRDPASKPAGTKKPARRPASSGLVGVAGFEPTTTCPPGKCATKLRYTPNFGANYILGYRWITQKKAIRTGYTEVFCCCNSGQMTQGFLYFLNQLAECRRLDDSSRYCSLLSYWHVFKLYGSCTRHTLPCPANSEALLVQQ